MNYPMIFFQLSYLLMRLTASLFSNAVEDPAPRVSQTFPMTSRPRQDRTVGFAREK